MTRMLLTRSMRCCSSPVYRLRESNQYAAARGYHILHTCCEPCVGGWVANELRVSSHRLHRVNDVRGFCVCTFIRAPRIRARWRPGATTINALLNIHTMPATVEIRRQNRHRRERPVASTNTVCRRLTPRTIVVKVPATPHVVTLFFSHGNTWRTIHDTLIASKRVRQLASRPTSESWQPHATTLSARRISIDCTTICSLALLNRG